MKRVLVCDDDRGIRELLRVTLEDEYEVVFASNGREAYDAIFQDRSIAGVVLDVMMPEMDGFEVLRRVRTEPATLDMAIVMLTARVAEDDYLHGYRYGADAYLSKPFDPEELLVALREVLARTPQQRAKIRNAEASKAALLRQLDRRPD
ncbi:MAG TPA: response regulator [Nitriliruptorales bacterium]